MGVYRAQGRVEKTSSGGHMADGMAQTAVFLL